MFDELNKLNDDKNRKQSYVPYEAVARLLIEAGHPDMAEM
jgi:hypothetical protein